MALFDKLGLFGGSFDPPHWGHLLIALRALESCGLDHILFIPCRQSPLKGAGAAAPGSQRLAMLRAALRDYAWAGVSEIELQREGPSYAIDTLRAVRASHPAAALSWIMGADQWNQLGDWKDYPTLVRELEFIVYPREVGPLARPGVRSVVLPFRYDISSTEIRERIRDGLDIRCLTPAPVADHIRENRLYL